jgi:ankyrin repeat protein
VTALQLRPLGARQDSGRSALLYAARYGHADVVRLLMAESCDTTLDDMAGHTAMQIARHYDHPAVAALLDGGERASERASVSSL